MPNPTDAARPPTGPAAWAPLGAALRAYHRGETTSEITIISDLWEDEIVPVAAFYRPDDEPLGDLDGAAIELCRGRVLDLGAGAGRHSLELQSADHEVVAVDVLPEAVEIMRDRGVVDARCGDLSVVAEERFDTVVMLMHGLGVVGDVHGLGSLLELLPEVLAPGGRLICDSADLASVLEEESPGLLDELSSPHRYLGETRFQLRYEDLIGPRYPWLFIDPERLEIIASAAGFRSVVARSGDRGSYLAVLTSPS
jgi:SAM-dependent methyltransferase